MPAPDSDTTSSTGDKPCRSCVDFKSWSKMQKKTLTTAAISQPTEENRKPTSSNIKDGPPPDCPLDKDQLGRATWGLLHTMAAHYPETPKPDDEKNMKRFYNLLSKLYPCEYCSHDMKKEIKKEPVDTTSQEGLSQWLCRFHNKVNVKLGKPEFDCSKVNQRWRDGWLDGSCD